MTTILQPTQVEIGHGLGAVTAEEHSSTTPEQTPEYMGQLLQRLEGDESLHGKTLRDGLRVLLGHQPVPDTTTWRHFLDYSRAVIERPEDSRARAEAPWAASVSDVTKRVLTLFGPDTIAAARTGCASLIETYGGGDGSSIPHIDKKANFIRNVKHQTPGRAFYPVTSPLAITTYEAGNMSASLSMLAWTDDVDQAVVCGMLTNHSICDDYHGFSGRETELRIRLIAMAVGAAFAHGERAPPCAIGGSLLQAQGSLLETRGAGRGTSIQSALAWRAIGGAATLINGTLFGPTSMAEAVVPPQIVMAIHDLFDWRSDTAAGNHENAITAIHGMGIQDAFHACVEYTLERAVEYPVPVLYAVAAITFMHYTSTRYGAHEYKGTRRRNGACDRCVELLQQATGDSGLAWRPTKPPGIFVDSAEARARAKLFLDEQKDTGKGLLQDGIGWFQYLATTGDIWLFDLTCEGVESVDAGTSWA